MRVGGWIEVLLTIDEFEQLVAEAWNNLPSYFLERLENVAITVEEWPDRETLRLAGLKNPAQLLGFYYGVPLTHRTSEYGMVAPDRITLFRRPILLGCRTDDEARALVPHVLRHEIAHYFGIDDDRLEELNAY